MNSYSEVANEIIKNYLPPGVNERQLAAFQTFFAPTVIAKLKVTDNVSDAALINEFSTRIPEPLLLTTNSLTPTK